MMAGKISKFRAHLVAVGMAIGITTIAYGTFQAAMVIKKWTHATPRLLHEEMDYFLYHKEQKGRMKALEEAKAK
ncbi:unnamed protein product [Cylicocyclus nassatus]|uniref:Uncharacterized protein n=1 Tax=Cylicocyclus nassatus TaxID=53992 RepID=A0AA36M3R9_CYLNA|nr:unnamed protein product [Cylicocyclus nassatus]